MSKKQETVLVSRLGAKTMDGNVVMPKQKRDPRKKIKDYWESPNTVSLIDSNLRRLEEEFICSYLSPHAEYADFGCGDGSSTATYIHYVKSCLALEQSDRLREKARAELTGKAEVVKGDVLDLSKYRGKFNTVSTQRVVINFMTWKEQQRVLKEIHSTLRPGGLYLAVENTFEGFDALNAVRRKTGIQNVPLHDWHNFFLHRNQFLDFMSSSGFYLEREHTFNLYYLLTRVFEHQFAKFEGFGANAKKDEIFAAADSAACELHSLLGDKIDFSKLLEGKSTSFGPIQGFVFRRV